MAYMSVLWDLLLCDFDDHPGIDVRSFQLDKSSWVCIEPVDATPTQFAIAGLLRSLPKKFIGAGDEVTQAKADKAAFELFEKINEEVKGDWRLDKSQCGPYDEVLLGEFKSAMWDFFNVEGFPLLDFAVIESGVDFGPGTSPGAEDTSFLCKLGHSELTASNKLVVSLFDEWVKASPLRVDCEIARTLAMGSPRVTESTRITPVPKTAKISRLVKPEPLLNMFFQKGVQKVLEDQLRRKFDIDLSVQPQLNAELARLGSETGAYATIDLSSASDYISVGFAKEFIPRASLDWLMGLRSERASVAVYDVESESALPVGEKVVSLNMLATMGNAFCFPLQTAVFSCVVKAVYRSLGLPWIEKSRGGWELRKCQSQDELQLMPFNAPKNWGVFGDDIVVLEEAFGPVKRLLKILGFQPNVSKSFGCYDGTFRESCGSDFYRGVNVRGVYCKRLNTEQDWYILINSLTDWSARHGIKLNLTMSWLLNQVHRTEVPPWENPDTGIRVPLASVQTEDVYQAPVYVLKPKNQEYLDSRTRPSTSFMGPVNIFGSKKRAWCPPSFPGSYLYKRWVPESRSFDVSESGRNDRRYWNSSARFIAAVKGALKGGKVSLRLYDTPYLKRVGVAPCWDYMQPGDVRIAFKQRWYAFAREYFG